MLSAQIVHTCGCGRRYTEDTWKQLADAKTWEIEPGLFLEQRACPCGSHTSREVGMVIVVGVCRGKFTVSAGEVEFLADTTVESLALALKRAGFDPNNENHRIVCSSSMDFPEDDGAPNLPAREILAKAARFQ